MPRRWKVDERDCEGAPSPRNPRMPAGIPEPQTIDEELEQLASALEASLHFSEAAEASVEPSSAAASPVEGDAASVAEAEDTSEPVPAAGTGPSVPGGSEAASRRPS